MILYLDLLLEAVLQMFWLREFNYALIYAPFLGLVVAIVLAPLLVAGLVVLVLVILGGGTLSRGSFFPLFRSLGYASGIGFALWIPFAPLLAVPYGAFVATVAVKETLNVTWARAAAATLIPLGAVILTVLVLLGPGEATGFLVNPTGSSQHSASFAKHGMAGGGAALLTSGALAGACWMLTSGAREQSDPRGRTPRRRRTGACAARASSPTPSQ